MLPIAKLVAAITANAAIVEEELRRGSHPEPSDDPTSSLEFPDIGPKGAKARVALLSAIHELDRVIQSPVEYMRGFSQGVCVSKPCRRRSLTQTSVSKQAVSARSSDSTFLK